MRWLRLYLRARRVHQALAVAVSVAGLAALLPANVRVAALTAMLAVAAFGPTLGAADEALERTGAVPWPPRRALHLGAVALLVAGLLVALVVGPDSARFEPLVVALRDVAGLLGLAALGAAVLGAAHAWVAPLLWTLVAVLPLLGPSADVRVQVAAWPVQPAATTSALVCALALAAAGLVAYSVRGARA
ncbi:hypothetical protein ABT369_17925 [Dactylosporangium sp. NPDC000244]|uniref:hypothetical protein n=1 Tax=Dactylosporangium sp. NPDC000244 TaxID=3154365 RepID=UPI00332C372D